MQLAAEMKELVRLKRFLVPPDPGEAPNVGSKHRIPAAITSEHAQAWAPEPDKVPAATMQASTVRHNDDLGPCTTTPIATSAKCQVSAPKLLLSHPLGELQNVPNDDERATEAKNAQVVFSFSALDLLTLRCLKTCADRAHCLLEPSRLRAQHESTPGHMPFVAHLQRDRISLATPLLNYCLASLLKGADNARRSCKSKYICCARPSPLRTLRSSFPIFEFAFCSCWTECRLASLSRAHARTRMHRYSG